MLAPSTSDSNVGIDVMITCPTAGAVIRYTLNEADPTGFDPLVTSGVPIRISRSAVLKARGQPGRHWSWGYNNTGQLGLGTTTNSSRAMPVKLDASTLLTGEWGRQERSVPE